MFPDGARCARRSTASMPAPRWRGLPRRILAGQFRELHDRRQQRSGQPDRRRPVPACDGRASAGIAADPGQQPRRPQRCRQVRTQHRCRPRHDHCRQPRYRRPRRGRGDPAGRHAGLRCAPGQSRFLRRADRHDGAARRLVRDRPRPCQRPRQRPARRRLPARDRRRGGRRRVRVFRVHFPRRLRSRAPAALHRAACKSRSALSAARRSACGRGRLRIAACSVRRVVRPLGKRAHAKPPVSRRSYGRSVGSTAASERVGKFADETLGPCSIGTPISLPSPNAAGCRYLPRSLGDLFSSIGMRFASA